MGRCLALEQFEYLETPLTLAAIRSREAGVRAARTQSGGADTLYFPFALSDKRPIRPSQGYLMRWPDALSSVFRVSAKAYPFLVRLFGIAVPFVLPTLLVLALIPPSRGLAGIGLILASFLFGMITWIWALLLTLQTWGWTAVIIGIVLGGVGVVPIARLATIVKGMWATLGHLLLCRVLTFGCRIGGGALGASAERRARLRQTV